MDNAMKTTATAPKGAKPPGACTSRAAEGPSSRTDPAFHKASGTARAASRKG